MTYFAALLIALSAFFSAPITAPSQALTYDSPSVTTEAAPKAPTAPIKAPTQAPKSTPTQAPKSTPTQAPTKAPVEAPICEEDQPCFDCSAKDSRVCVNGVPQAPKYVPASTRWVEATLAAADFELTPNVAVVFSDTSNCGADISTVAMGGCTYATGANTYTIVMSPGLVGTAGGQHILFHELGHTVGMGECEAEAYAHQFEESPLWSYPNCAITGKP